MYIAKGKEYNTIERHENAPLFKRVFDCKTSEKSTIKITVVGLYRLFLNGKELNKSLFAPYLSNPDEIVFYDEYDVSGQLKPKNNVLCVLLGNGFVNSNDFNIWQNETASYRSAPKFDLQLKIGGETFFESDEEFLVTDSPITFDDFRCGERYDANLEIENVLESTSLENFRNPLIVAPPKGEIIRNTAQPVVAAGERTAAAITKTEKGYIYDFGVNDTGIPCLEINAHAQSNPEYVQHDVYICKNGLQKYKPSFTWHGCRYAEVRGISAEQATKDLLTFIPVHSSVGQICRFQCDNETINKLVEITLRSDKSNFIFYPYDCPHREKNGWTADAAISAEQMLYTFDAYESLRQWLLCIRKAQRKDGALPGIIPTAGWGFTFGNGPAWDSVLIELPYQLYRFYGKSEIVTENAAAIEKYFKYIKTKFNADGLIEIGLGDWCQTYTHAEGEYETPVEVTDSLTMISLAGKTVDMFEKVGLKAEKIENFGKVLRENFRKKYVVDEKLTVQTQTALAMCLQLNIFTAKEKKEAYAQLLENIRRQGNHFRVGVIGYRYLFETLAKHGDRNLCFHLIAQNSFPSYGYILGRGATTLWESFEEYERKDGELQRKDGVKRIPSFNHHFWGGVLAWIYRYIGWLDIKSEDTIEISPMMIKGMNCAEIAYSRNGKSVAVSWKQENGKLQLNVKSFGFKCILKHGEKTILPNGDSRFEFTIK